MIVVFLLITQVHLLVAWDFGREPMVELIWTIFGSWAPDSVARWAGLRERERERDTPAPRMYSGTCSVWRTSPPRMMIFLTEAPPKSRIGELSASWSNLGIFNRAFRASPEWTYSYTYYLYGCTYCLLNVSWNGALISWWPNEWCLNGTHKSSSVCQIRPRKANQYLSGSNLLCETGARKSHQFQHESLRPPSLSSSFLYVCANVQFIK